MLDRLAGEEQTKEASTRASREAGAGLTADRREVPKTARTVAERVRFPIAILYSSLRYVSTVQDTAT